MMHNLHLFNKNKRKIIYLLLSFSLLTIILISTAFVTRAIPILSATKSDLLIIDNDGDNFVDPGDTIRYAIVITNSGTIATSNSNFVDTIDANTTLVAGSVRTTPIARNDVYAAIGNVGITVPAGSGILANDNDPDGTTPTLTIVSPPTSSTSGGNVSINADGSFTYVPAPGFEGTDTFKYVVQDSDGNQDPATVIITISDVIWFIDNSAGGGGDGRLSSPFNSLADFNATTADDPGDVIFIYTGSGNYSDGIPLLASQMLVGQGATASLATIAGITVPTHSNALPTTNGTRPVISNSGGSGVTLNNGNLIRGLNIGDTSTSTGAGISGTTVGNLTVTEVSITGQGKAVDINFGTLNVSLDAVTVTSASNGGFSLQNTTGSTTISALNLTTTGGTGFLASNAGTVNVSGATNSVSSTSGTAVNLTNTTIGSSGITLQSVSSSGADTGITLNNTGSGDFTVTGTGTTDGSGGTLQNLNDHGIELINAQDVSISNMNLTNATTTQDVAVNTATCDDESGGTNTACNAPVQMVNASNISLTNLTINGSVQHGINGNNVNGLSISNTDVSNIGNDQLENGMHIINLVGTVNFNNLNIDGSETRNVLIENNTGTANITVTNSSFNNTTTANGEDGFHLIGSSSANVTLNVNNSSFIHNHGPQLKAHAEDSSTVNATIVDNTFDGEPTIVGNTGVDLAVRDNANLLFNVSGTTLGDQVFQPIRGQVINVFALGNGTASGRINRNDINGSNQASGVRVVSSVTTSGNPNVTVEIDGNDIDGISGVGNAGIHIDSRNGVAAATGTANVQATINDNDVTITGADSIIQAYSNSGNIMCLDVTNNNAAGAATSPYAGAGSTHYIGNPIAGTLGGAGTVTYDGYIANDLGGTWNANGNSPTLAAGIAGEAYVDGTQPTNGTCATVAQIAAPIVVADSTMNRADVWAFVDQQDDMRAAYLNTPALAKQPTNDTVASGMAPSAITATAKTDTTAKPAQSGETINLALGTLDPGQVIVITFDVTVDSTIPANVTQVCNQGVISSDNHVNLSTDDPTIGGISDPTCTAVPQADLRIEKSDSADPVNPSGSYIYTLNVTNDGPSTAQNVVATDTLPAGVTYVSDDCGLTGTPGPALTWTIGSLANGATATCNITVTAPSTTGIVTNNASVSSTTHDPDSANNSVSETTDVTETVDLMVTKTESADPVIAGSGPGNLTYVVTVTNNGPFSATGVTLSEVMTLPTGVTIDSVTASQGSFSDPAWTVGALTVGQSETLTVVLTVASDAAAGTDVVSNTATVTAVDQALVNTGDDSATISTSIGRQIDLTIDVSESIDPVLAGSGADNLIYTLTATNNGPSDASGVAINIGVPTPSGVTINSITPSVGSFSNPAWTIPTLAKGQSATLEIKITVDNTAVAGTDVLSATGAVAGANETIINTGDDNDAEYTSIVTNQPPVANNDSYNTNEDTALVEATVGPLGDGVLANDTDADGDSLTAVLDSDVSNGVLVLNSDGSFTYTPTTNYCGADSFTYHANDGTVDSNTATVDINVICVNDAPAANDDSYSTNEDTTLVEATVGPFGDGVLVNDTDVESDPLTAVLDSNVSNGSLSLNNDGSFTYTPAANFCGVDSFTYHANDGTDDSNTATVNIDVICSNDDIYVSVHTHGQVDQGQIDVNDEDIISYQEPLGIWEIIFDGDDVYVEYSDLDAFHILPDNSILMSFDTPNWVEGVGNFDDSDIVRFIPTQLGNTTSGTWELYFDGSDVGLSKGAEDIDAIGFAPDGRLVLSTKGEFDIPGLTGSEHDLIIFNDTSLGWTTSGTFEMYLDGSDVDLTEISEDIWGVWIDPTTNDIYLTTKADFSVSGLSGKGSDIFICTPSSLGVNTSCTFTFFWDGTNAGLDKNLRLNGIHIQ